MLSFRLYIWVWVCCYLSQWQRVKYFSQLVWVQIRKDLPSLIFGKGNSQKSKASEIKFGLEFKNQIASYVKLKPMILCVK